MAYMLGFLAVILMFSVSYQLPHVPVPLLDRERAPLVADLDMTNVKSYIEREVATQIKTLINETVSAIVQEETAGLVQDLERLKLIVKDVQSGGEVSSSLSNNSKDLNIKDCTDLLGKHKEDGVYQIYPSGFTGYNVYCDMTTSGGGWTVFQRRYNGSLRFHDKLWNDYKHGFGHVSGEYWLENERLHQLTTKIGSYKLRIDLKDWSGDTVYAEYDDFFIKDSAQKYALKIGTYSGNAGNALQSNNGAKFSTDDNQNDGRLKDNECTTENLYNGAWWFPLDCGYSDLNGEYVDGGKGLPRGRGIIWVKQILGKYDFGYSWRETKMMFKRQ